MIQLHIQFDSQWIEKQQTQGVRAVRVLEELAADADAAEAELSPDDIFWRFCKGSAISKKV